MIGYLPELYPDELVYSWFSRYLVHSGHRLHSAVLREFFCKRSDNPSKEFLGHLNEDAKNVIQKVIPLRELILQHTTRISIPIRSTSTGLLQKPPKNSAPRIFLAMIRNCMKCWQIFIGPNSLG